MTFFRTATEQRIKEAKSVKYFLSVSLIGSLAVHIGVLTSGIGNLFSVAPPTEEDKPIEITFVEPQTQETPKPEEKKQQVLPSLIPVTPKRPAKRSQSELPVAKVNQQELTTERQPKQIPQQRVEQPKAIAPETPQNPAPTQPSTNNELPETNVLTSTANDASVAFESGRNITDNSNTSRTRDGNPTGSRREKRETVATGSSTPNPPTDLRRTGGEANGGDGRAACSECDTDYPEEARRNGVEGRVEVAVDTDAEGNVTNVRIVSSSGNRELDEATLRQAREWKLKPSQKNRQNTRIATEYAIEGSQRHRELQQERSRQRQTTAVQPGRNRRQMETATNTGGSTSTSRQQQTATTTNTRSTPTSRQQQTTSTTRTTTNQRSHQSNVATRSSSRNSYTPRRQTSTTQPSRRVRRTNVATSPSRNSTTTQIRRKRRSAVTTNNNSNTVRQPMRRQRRD